MDNSQQDPTAERLIAGIMTIFFALLGWFTLLQGGVSFKGKSGNVSFADGSVGLAVAGGFLMFATLAAAMFLRSFNPAKSTYYIAGAIMLLPPIVYVFFPT